MKDMHYYEVAPTQIIRSTAATFTYSSEAELPIGQLVVIEAGKKRFIGIVIKKVSKPIYATKPILDHIEEYPLPRQLVDLALWMSEYYVTHLATVLSSVLPQGLQKTRRKRPPLHRPAVRDRTNFVLNKEQQHAVDTIASSPAGTSLLHGVTGSGKTAVYIELAKRAMAEGRSVIVLVPEIALTSQLVDAFSQHFDSILLTHSKQTEADRHTIWREALTSTSPRVAIGPRSALFLPLQNVGYIFIDEAHEPSFKQEKSPRYSALRAASILSRNHAATLVLGSATPSIADYYLAKHASRPILTLARPAQKGSKAPDLHLVDMTKKDSFKNHRFLSDRLLNEMEKTLTQKKQVLIFHNRRGSAPITLCETCGWSALCTRCFVPMTLHADKHLLRCHICASSSRIPTSCPSCHAPDIIHRGIGTKLIEAELAKRFPNNTIARFDGDNISGESVDERYRELYDGTIDIIIGTQVVAKGLDLPHLQTVGVIQADAGLAMPDFNANERTFQLIAQVAGRVGRSSNETSLVIQSFQPSHPAIAFGVKQDYAGFFETTIAERKRAHFPPFCHLLKLTCSYKTEAAAVRNAQALAAQLRAQAPKGVQVLGPTPAFYERQRDTYRWQLVIKSQKRSDLVDLLNVVPPTHWQSELDPVSLI